MSINSKSMERAFTRVSSAKTGCAAVDQSDDDIAALRSQLYQWIATLDAELHKRGEFQAMMDRVSADMEEDYEDRAEGGFRP